jgi:hypothetical protein
LTILRGDKIMMFRGLFRPGIGQQPRTFRGGYRTLFFLLTCWSVPGAGCVQDEALSDLQRAHPSRRIVSVAWDTLVRIGRPDPNDTTLLQPSGLMLWDDRIVVKDGANQDLRVFLRNGEAEITRR